VQDGCNHGGGESVGAVCHGSDCHEEETKHHSLKHRRRLWAQKLGQERGKEYSGLGIEQGNHETFMEHATQW